LGTQAVAAKRSFRTYTVIGVTRDVEGRRMTSAFSRPSLYLPAPLDSAGMSFAARVKGDPWQGRQALLADLGRIPIAASIRTLKTASGLMGYLLGLAFWVAVFLGGLALALTVSALFSILSFLIEQRTKEIGVRVALGATKREVAWLVVSQAIRPVVIGLSAGTALAAALTTAMLSMPVAALISDVIPVFDLGAYLGSVFVVVTACSIAALVPALRAARTDPMVSLRAQ
jgi:hypothetical protein